MEGRIVGRAAAASGAPGVRIAAGSRNSQEVDVVIENR